MSQFLLGFTMFGTEFYWLHGAVLGCTCHAPHVDVAQRFLIFSPVVL